MICYTTEGLRNNAPPFIGALRMFCFQRKAVNPLCRSFKTLCFRENTTNSTISVTLPIKKLLGREHYRPTVVPELLILRHTAYVQSCLQFTNDALLMHWIFINYALTWKGMHVCLEMGNRYPGNVRRTINCLQKRNLTLFFKIQRTFLLLTHD